MLHTCVHLLMINNILVSMEDLYHVYRIEQYNNNNKQILHHLFIYIQFATEDCSVYFQH